MSLLITGSTGFVGRALAMRLGDQQVGLDTRTDTTVWVKALVGITAVIHLAARVHVMRDTETDPLTAFRVINLLKTILLFMTDWV